MKLAQKTNVHAVTCYGRLNDKSALSSSCTYITQNLCGYGYRLYRLIHGYHSYPPNLQKTLTLPAVIAGHNLEWETWLRAEGVIYLEGSKQIGPVKF